MSFTTLTQKTSSCYRTVWAIALTYFAPLVLLVIYRPYASRWTIYGVGMFTSLLGTLLLFLLLRQWEERLVAKEAFEADNQKNFVEISALNEALERCKLVESSSLELIAEREIIARELSEKKHHEAAAVRECSKLKHQLEQLNGEFQQYKESSREKLEQNNIFLGEFQQTIHEQRSTLEQKQLQIEQLDNKVRDLTFEIKTLLQIAEKGEKGSEEVEFACDSDEYISTDITPIFTDREDDKILQQLRSCIEIAQKITGSHKSTRQSRSRSLPTDNYALDLRRLCEGLSSESGFPLILFSQKEEKVLFSNAKISELLGWSREKFAHQFDDIIEASSEEWRCGVSQLAYKNDCQFELELKSKNGELIAAKCYLGVIPTGLFRSNVIAIIAAE